MNTDHINTLSQVQQRKLELKALILAEKQEMSDIAKAMQESLKPHNLASSFLRGLIPADDQTPTTGDSLESMVSLFTTKNEKLNKFLRVAVLVTPIVMKIIKIFRKKKGKSVETPIAS